MSKEFIAQVVGWSQTRDPARLRQALHDEIPISTVPVYSSIKLEFKSGEQLDIPVTNETFEKIAELSKLVGDPKAT